MVKSYHLCMRKIKSYTLSLFIIISMAGINFLHCTSNPTMPRQGICSHRGARDTHPENTLAAFRHAIRLGAHMIECDVQLSKDSQMVIMHDATVDRTTNGSGRVSDLTLDELKSLDAGSWHHQAFAGERIPTLREVLEIMPRNVWLNLHLKNSTELGRMVTELLIEQNRLHQSFLACNKQTAAAAKNTNSDVKICNMDRTDSSQKYVSETIARGTEFIQLKRRSQSMLPELVGKLKSHEIVINFFGTNSPKELRVLFQAGVDFPLVDELTPMMQAARDLGIEPLKPVY